MDALLLLLLPAAACGAMMIGCVWLMRRGMASHRPGDHGDAPASESEIAALREEVTRLRDQQAAIAEPHTMAREANETDGARRGRVRQRHRRRPPGPRGAPWAVIAVAALGVLAAALVVLAVAVALAPGDGGRAGGLAGAPDWRFTHVHGLAIPPWAPDDVYLATHFGLIRISSDGEWQYASEERHDFMGFATHPSTEGVFYTSGHPDIRSGLKNPLGFMVSTDAGRSWQVRSLYGEADFHAMAVDHADGEVIYGFDVTVMRLLRSRDAGRSWDLRTLPHPQGAFSLAVDPGDPDTVLAGTRVGLQASTDGAATWEPVLDGEPVTAVAFQPGASRRMVIYSAAPGRGLLGSSDGGRSWRPLGLELDDDAAGHIALHPTDGDIIYVGTFGEALYRTVDRGATWQQLADDGVPRRDEQ
jgi:photosystem II stability/assembly factor-like uncharacterized protein